MPRSPWSISPFHIRANVSGVSRSRPVSSRRRDAHSGSFFRPRRPRSSRVTRCRSSVSMSFASWTRWNRSATTTASGSAVVTARREDADRSNHTWVTPARHCSGCSMSQSATVVAVRPLTCASRPPVPAASTIPVCHRSWTIRHRPVSGSLAHTGLPRRVAPASGRCPQSIPSTWTAGNGSAAAARRGRRTRRARPARTPRTGGRRTGHTGSARRPARRTRRAAGSSALTGPEPPTATR